MRLILETYNGIRNASYKGPEACWSTRRNYPLEEQSIKDIIASIEQWAYRYGVIKIRVE